MKLKGTVSLALLVSGALLLGACTSGEEPGAADGSAKSNTTAGQSAEPTKSDDPCLTKLSHEAPAEGSVAFTAGPGDWKGYNAITADTYSTYNTAVADRMFSGFSYYGVDGSLCLNEEFGTFTVTSEDPLIVEYTIDEKAVWSDGTPVTINDYLLEWAAQNPEFLAPDFFKGVKGSAPVFKHVSKSFAEKVPDGPKGEIGGKKFSVTFANPDPDFKILIGSALPAHIVAKQSGLEPEALAKAILEKDAETVKKAAEFWNNGWIFQPGELPSEDLIPSNSRYKLKQGGWQAGNSLTLEANDKYWGTPAATKELVVRFFEDAAATQALQNGEVNVISPQATVDTVAQLKSLGESVKVDQYAVMTWEHLDFNHTEGNVMANPKVREAFAYCTPRAEIVEKLVKPINSEAVVMNAREAFPFQKEKYEAITSAAYDGRYDKVDVEKAKALLAEAGVPTPVKVRLGYKAPNQRRQETVALIQASCNQAGFEIIDSGVSSFFDKELPNRETEVALFAWAGSGQITSGENIYATNKPQNRLGYSNPKVDEAWEKVSATLDEKVHLEQYKVIEKELWDTLYGIPLYAHPGVSAHSADLQNVRPTATQSGTWWNAQQWVRAS